AASVVEAPSTMEMSLKAEKSSFTMDEVKAGTAKTTVSLYVDKLEDAEKLTLIMAGFKASDSNIKLSNIAFTEKQPGLSFYGATEKYNTAKRRYSAYSSDEANMNFIIQNDPKTYLVLENPDVSIVTFDVEFPTTMAEGTYTIGFNSEYTAIKSSAPFVDKSDPEYGTIITDYTKSVMNNSNGLKPATITLGAAAPTTEPPATEATEDTTKEKIFDGEIKFWADKVEAKAGETVEVNLYADADLNGDGTVMGVESRAVFDTAKLTIENMEQDFGFEAKATLEPNVGAYVIASTGEAITNDPESPFAIIKFKVSADAKVGDVYEIGFAGCNDHAEPIAQKEQFSDYETYYKPVIENGSITIVGDATEPTDPPATEATEDTTKEKIFDGEIKFWADKVEAKPGETVEVNLYADADLNGDGTVMGVEARAVFDTAKLTIENMEQDFGFEAKATLEPNVGAYVIASTGEAITNDPESPFAIITFKVSADAKVGDVYEIGFAGCNDHAEPIAQKEQFSDYETYYKPVIENGSITIVGDATEETDPPATTVTTPAPATTVSTTVATTPAPATTVKTDAPSTDVSIVTSISVVEVTSISVVEVTSIKEVEVTSIKEIEVTKPVEVEVTKIVEVTTIVPYPGTVIATVTSIVPVEVTSIKEVEVTKPVEVTSIKEIEVTKPVEVEVTKIVEVTTIVPYPGTVIATVTSIVPVEVTSIKEVEVTSIKEVEVTNVVTVTSIVEVPITVVTTTTAGGSGTYTFETNYNNDADQDQWYHSDNVEFFKDGIVIKDAEGNDVTADAEIKFATTPGEVYDGKTFDYEVDFTAEINGVTLTGTIPVKIGPRGDSNMSGGKSADIYDAIIIAKFILPKPAADIPEGSFQEFLADNNEDGIVNIYDAINVAKLILPANNGDWSKVSKDYSKWILD
ncbi:MAG: hypothetical protein MR503_05925, partial [Oscillospiraceae bacterium]|nr:hypothetical protein [Oscillospiraceae bacterium]